LASAENDQQNVFVSFIFYFLSFLSHYCLWKEGFSIFYTMLKKEYNVAEIKKTGKSRLMRKKSRTNVYKNSIIEE